MNFRSKKTPKTCISHHTHAAYVRTERNIKVSKYKYGHITSLDLKKKMPSRRRKSEKNPTVMIRKRFYVFSSGIHPPPLFPSELEAAASFKIQEGVNHWRRKDSLPLSFLALGGL